jgi:hypothetical protein
MSDCLIYCRRQNSPPVPMFIPLLLGCVARIERKCEDEGAGEANREEECSNAANDNDSEGEEKRTKASSNGCNSMIIT